MDPELMKDVRNRRLMYKIKRVIDSSKLRYQLVPLPQKQLLKLRLCKQEFNLLGIDEICNNILKILKDEDDRKLKTLFNITTHSISMMENLSVFTKQDSIGLH